jgi:hypothetical protein
MMMNHKILVDGFAAVLVGMLIAPAPVRATSSLAATSLPPAISLPSRYGDVDKFVRDGQQVEERFFLLPSERPPAGIEPGYSNVDELEWWDSASGGIEAAVIASTEITPSAQFSTELDDYPKSSSQHIEPSASIWNLWVYVRQDGVYRVSLQIDAGTVRAGELTVGEFKPIAFDDRGDKCDGNDWANKCLHHATASPPGGPQTNMRKNVALHAGWHQISMFVVMDETTVPGEVSLHMFSASGEVPIVPYWLPPKYESPKAHPKNR